LKFPRRHAEILAPTQRDNYGKPKAKSDRRMHVRRGALRYAAPAPHSVIYCHCRDCRRHTGAPLVSFVGYQMSEIKWSGDARKIYKSSANIGRGFCGKCGTPSKQRNKVLGEIIL
jgi:hypothetical protein